MLRPFSNTKVLKLYESYKLLCDKLLYKLCELFVLSNFSPNTIKNKYVLESITDNIYNKVIKDFSGINVLCLINEEKRSKLYDTITLIEDVYYSLLYNFNMNNLFTLMESLSVLNKTISEIKELVSDKYIKDLDVTKEIILFENADTTNLADIKNSIYEILNSLKSSMVKCNNENENVDNLISCQTKVLDDHINKLKSLLDKCPENEECKLIILKYISKLEYNKKELLDII